VEHQNDMDALPLARLPNESARAHEALLCYAELGPGRSLAKAAQVLGKRGAYVGQLERWSSQHHWQQRVKAYDVHLARQRQRAAAEQYIAGVEAHQERYAKAATDLHTVAQALLAKLALMLNEDRLSISASTLNVVLKAFEGAAELEAHALSLDRLLPLLDYDDEATQ
jgi:hypothetical protein